MINIHEAKDPASHPILAVLVDNEFGVLARVIGRISGVKDLL